MPRWSKKFPARFNALCLPEPNSGCWIWMGALWSRGYGRTNIGKGQKASAHVMSFRLHKGEIEDGMVVRHTCDCKWCVNPDHLLLGSPQDNIADAVRRGRNARGETSGKAKLSADQVAEIRSDIRKHKDIAAQYGVTARTIGHIKAGKRWKHLPAASQEARS